MAGTRMAAPLLALFALTQVFLALPAGRFADRHGRKRPVAYSVIAATAGAVVGIAGVFWVMGAVVAGGTRLAFRPDER